MDKETLTAQKLLNACILKYSLVKMDWDDCYNFPSTIGFYGYTVKVDDKDNFFIAGDFFFIAGDFGYTTGDSEITCIGWEKYTTLEDAYKHLDYLLAKLSRFERNNKRHLETQRLKKIKDDF